VRARHALLPVLLSLTLTHSVKVRKCVVSSHTTHAHTAATDAERVVLFDDVRQFVARLTLPELHYELLCQLTALLGYEAPPRRPTSHRLVQVCARL
jgi:hypothetical protein